MQSVTPGKLNPLEFITKGLLVLGAAGAVRGLLEAAAPVSGSYNHRNHARSIDASDLCMAAGREDFLQRSSEVTGQTMRVDPYLNTGAERDYR